MNPLLKPIACFLCQKMVQGKDMYTAHLLEDHNVSDAEDMVEMYETSNENPNKEIETKSNLSPKENKSQQNLNTKSKLKLLRENVKKMHINCDNVGDDDFQGVTWFDRVKYECLECKANIFGNRNIANHMRYSHKIWKKQVIHRSYKLVSKDDKYICKLCNTAVKMDNLLIKHHLQKVHKTKLLEYEDMHEPGKRFDQRRSKIAKGNDLPALQERECVGIKWYDRVKYQCNLCDHESIGDIPIKHHIKSSHAKRGIKNSYTTLTNYLYSCKICEREIRLNRNTICMHVNRSHSLKFSDYESKYEPMKTKDSNVSNKQIKERNKSKKIKTNTLQHHANMISNKSYTHAENKKDQNIPWHSRVSLSCNLCSKEIVGFLAIKKHLKKEHGSEMQNEYTQLNKEQYSCKICTLEIKLGYLSVFKHVENVHGMKFDLYEEQYENCLKQNVQKNACSICNETLKETPTSLRRHMRNHHKKPLRRKMRKGIRPKQVVPSSPFYPQSSTELKAPSPLPLSLPFPSNSPSPSPTPNQFPPPLTSSLLTPPPTPTPPPSYLCPLPSCSFSLPKPEMKAGGAARHLIVCHCLTAKDVGAGKWKWEKI